MQPERIILASVVLTGGLLTWRGLQAGNISPRTYAALGLVSLVLFGVGSFFPDLAAAIAVLVLVTVLLSEGDQLEALTKLVTPRRRK